MNKKILSLLFASTLILGACGEGDSESTDETTTNDEIEDTSKNEEEKSQEEIDKEKKEEAVLADFTEINGNEDAEGMIVYAKGEISNVDYDNVMDVVPSFLLTQEKGEGVGLYHISNALSFEGLEDGDIVTVYGAVGEPGEDGIPKIIGTIIEQE